MVHMTDGFKVWIYFYGESIETNIFLGQGPEKTHQDGYLVKS